ncbi:MAG: sigma-70 family RNA polymerase sigma factor [Lachnospiraceae bacterium]|nr:sigma-70 family RNA polymerase sigma factor [Lachnospiraceae bacterium]
MRSRKETLVRSILLENYQSYYRLAFSYVHQEADAMDIVQEGAYKAMRKAGSLREEAFAGTWVYRIMINTAKDYVKKYRREYEMLNENMIDTKAQDSDMDLREAVDKLPMQEKTLIILRFYEDKPLAEIAEILQENLSTVKSRLYRTLEKLRKELDLDN